MAVAGARAAWRRSVKTVPVVHESRFVHRRRPRPAGIWLRTVDTMRGSD